MKGDRSGKTAFRNQRALFAKNAADLAVSRSQCQKSDTPSLRFVRRCAECVWQTTRRPRPRSDISREERHQLSRSASVIHFRWQKLTA